MAVPFSRVLVDEVAQLDRIELHLQDNRFVGFNADHKQLQVLAAGLRVDVVVLAAAPGEVLDQRPPAGGAGVCHQLVEAAIEFRRVQMLLIENGGFVIELAAKSADGKFLLAGARPR